MQSFAEAGEGRSHLKDGLEGKTDCRYLCFHETPRKAPGDFKCNMRGWDSVQAAIGRGTLSVSSSCLVVTGWRKYSGWEGVTGDLGEDGWVQARAE